MKEILMDILTQIINQIFALLAIICEIRQCINEAVVTDVMGYAIATDRISVAYVKLFMPRILRDHRHRSMKNLIYFRLFGHAVASCLHTYHLIGYQWRLKEYLPTHPELKELNDLNYRYLTIWNLMLQLFYTSLAMVCDLTTVYERENLVPAWLRGYRFTLFAGLVWPISWSVSMFWPLYLYREDLVVKPGFELVLTPGCNFDFHATVLMYSLWELIFVPKQYIIFKNSFALLHCLIVGGAYAITIYYTRYIDLKIWVYKVLEDLEGSLFLELMIAGTLLQAFIAYFVQIPIKMYLWRELLMAKKKKKTK